MPAAKDPTRRRLNMLAIRAKAKPGVQVVSRAEQVRRMNLIEQLYLEYRQVGRVARMCAAGIDMPDGTRFRCSQSSAQKYIRRIEERWLAESEETRPYLLEQSRKAIVAHIRAAKGDKKWSAVSSLSRLLADVDGLIAPQRHQVEHSASRDLLAMFAGWSVEDKRRYAETGQRPGQVAEADVEDPFASAVPPSTSPGSNGAGAEQPKPNGGNGAGT